MMLLVFSTASNLWDINMSWVDELMKMPLEERTKLTWHDPKIVSLAEATEKKYNLPPGSLRAIKYAENSYIKNGVVQQNLKQNSTATSPAGAQGIMQIMPATQKLQNGMFKHNPLDPVENIDAAGRYLQFTLKNQYKGNLLAAIADYNGGPKQAKAVMAGKKPTAKETDDYMIKAKSYFERMQKK
jgi:soluble lytic murein transglycosylase-like protein